LELHLPPQDLISGIPSPDRNTVSDNSSSALYGRSLASDNLFRSGAEIRADRLDLSLFLNSCNSHSIIPTSGKIVVLDTTLAVKSAFHALEQNNIKSAPLWDSILQDYVGIITVTDFIQILLHFHNKLPDVPIFEELEKHEIKTWREIIGQKVQTKLIYTDPESTLYDAISTFLSHRIHRLPIIDRAESNTILHIITQKRILSFLMEKLSVKPPIFACTIESLGIGTYKNVVTVLKDTPLSFVLTYLAERNISAVPIVDENGSVIDVYAKSDVVALVKKPSVKFNFLDKAIGETLQERGTRRIHCCYKTETLELIVERLIATGVYRLICVDSTNRVEGIISISDILKFFFVNLS